LGEDEIDDWIYNWTPGIDVSDSTLADPTIWVDTTQTIVVEVIDPWTECVFTDSITFLYDSVYVNILISDTTICNDTYTIPVESYSSMDLIWTPTSDITGYFLDSIQANIVGATTFTATAYGFYGVCEMTDQVTIENLPPPTQNLWDTTACTEDGFLYFPSPIWYDNGTPVQLVNLQEDGIYYFSETNQCGHVVHEIEVDLEFCSCEMYVPNSFTPDGDNRNDGFVPMTDCNLQHYRIEIYNRWGELIFESFDINEQWYGTYKGKTVQDGTYTWKIEYTDTFTGVNRSLIGHISVLK
jgi:gliding motility-associated-like protein